MNEHTPVLLKKLGFIPNTKSILGLKPNFVRGKEVLFLLHPNIRFSRGCDILSAYEGSDYKLAILVIKGVYIQFLDALCAQQRGCTVLCQENDTITEYDGMSFLKEFYPKWLEPKAQLPPPPTEREFSIKLPKEWVCSDLSVNEKLIEITEKDTADRFWVSISQLFLRDEPIIDDYFAKYPTNWSISEKVHRKRQTIFLKFDWSAQSTA